MMEMTEMQFARKLTKQELETYRDQSITLPTTR